MDEYFKKIEMRDDGFLEVILKRAKDFDDYLYQQMQKDTGCLPCVRDPKTKSKLYYDTKGYINLRSYLKSYMFNEMESVDFLIYVLESMIKVNTSKPILMDLDYIFLSHGGGILRFLVIPCEVDQWVFQKSESKIFITQLTNEIRVSQGYESIGYLTYMQRYEEISLPMILQGLHDLKEQHKPKLSLFEKLFHLHKQEEYIVKDIPLPKAYPDLSVMQNIMDEQSEYMKEPVVVNDIHNETVVLFHEDELILYEKENKTEIKIEKAVFTIGRAKDNDLCLNEPYISLHHAKIYRDIKEIEDLNSSNGTFINQKRIKRSNLTHQCVLSFAQRQFHVLIR